MNNQRLLKFHKEDAKPEAVGIDANAKRAALGQWTR
jgi:hypothetical protein